jgi:Tripartite ATP-independent periplasmic transporter, DctM component
VHHWIESVSGDNRIVIMYLMVVVLTIAGDFLDGVPAIAIFMPIIVSLSALGHIHPAHMGVLIIVSLAFGLITPPYGLILLLSSTLAGVTFARALRQAVPLYCVYFLVISVIIFFPTSCCGCRASSSRSPWGAFRIRAAGDTSARRDGRPATGRAGGRGSASGAGGADARVDPGTRHETVSGR